MAVTEGFDEEIGNGMMEKTGINAQQHTEGHRHCQTNLLSARHLGFNHVAIFGTVNVDLALFVVRAEADTFNKGAFGGIVVVVVAAVKEIILHLASAFGACGMKLVAHVAVGVVIRSVVL